MKEKECAFIEGNWGRKGIANRYKRKGEKGERKNIKWHDRKLKEEGKLRQEMEIEAEGRWRRKNVPIKEKKEKEKVLLKEMKEN